MRWTEAKGGGAWLKKEIGLRGEVAGACVARATAAQAAALLAERWQHRVACPTPEPQEVRRQHGSAGAKRADALLCTKRRECIRIGIHTLLYTVVYTNWVAYPRCCMGRGLDSAVHLRILIRK